MNYKSHREYLKNIMTLVFKNKYNTHDYLIRSAISMGLKVTNNQIYYSDESDQESYWDFTIYEKINGNKSLLDYSLQNDYLPSEENNYLNRIQVFDTALFKIGKSNGENTKIVNIENGNEYLLSDISLSQQQIDENYIFLRLLKNQEYYMGSGFYFYFSKDIIDTVLRRKKILTKTEYKINKSITLYRVMFKLYKMYGTTIKYSD